MNAVRKTLRALAKINLDLRVLGKRADGYHELRTIFQTISLEDRITVRLQPAERTAIVMDGNVVIDHNLIERAARMVLQEVNASCKIDFHLEKRIPMGAGLGGGSSDASAILLGLPGLLGKTIASARLHELAASLGSDVPFFLYGGTAVGIGRGEELFPLPDAPRLFGLLVAPEVHVSTAEAYGALSPRLAGEQSSVKVAAFGQVAWTEDWTRARNDFEEPVFEKHPELAVIRQRLGSTGAVCARMTGSGAALFGLFQNPAAVEAARSQFPEHRTFPFSLISRKRYRAIWR